MKEIKLTQGKVALVDDADYEWLSQWKWYAMKQHNTFYAVRNVWVGKNKARGIRMHRLILGLTDFSIKSDHKDHNGLNNQRYNLRAATNSQNAFNNRSHQDSTSPFLGVSFFKRDGNWQAQISTDGKQKHIGFYKSEVEAAKAYNEAAIQYHGVFANLNAVSL